MMSILKEIETLRQQLHTLINEDANFAFIYDKSVELDQLISSYYRVS